VNYESQLKYLEREKTSKQTRLDGVVREAEELNTDITRLSCHMAELSTERDIKVAQLDDAKQRLLAVQTALDELDHVF
jgi:chromosome segregation ATPase